jgi:hypothetical protein
MVRIFGVRAIERSNGLFETRAVHALGLSIVPRRDSQILAIFMHVCSTLRFDASRGFEGG